MLLSQLGADAGILSQFETYAAQGFVPGRVAVSIRDRYRVYAEAGEYSAEPTGALLYGAASQAELPVVGDWVALRVIGRDEALVHAVLARRTQFSRRAAGRREDQQVIAANIDTALIVCGLDGDFNPRRLERYLTLGYESGAGPLIVLTKTDLCGDVQDKSAEARAVSRGAPVVAVSSMSERGIAPLMQYLTAGKTFVLLGSSGAGKSTLLNRLLGVERQPTAAVRASDSRGRHTTTHRELMALPQGAILIDTPGMRELQLWAGGESLDQSFDDVAGLAAACRFDDCGHESEPGCAVKEALASGALEGARWESYCRLQREIHHHRVMTDKDAAFARKQRWKTLHKAQRDLYKRRSK